jgi:hypothetical protein
LCYSEEKKNSRDSSQRSYEMGKEISKKKHAPAKALPKKRKRLSAKSLVTN